MVDGRVPYRKAEDRSEGKPSTGRVPDPSEARKIDRRLEVVSDARRRFVIQTMATRQSCPLDELARKMASWECEETPESLCDHEIDTRRRELHHHHLPKLEEANVIQVEEDSNAIGRTERTPQFATVSQLIEEHVLAVEHSEITS